MPEFSVRQVQGDEVMDTLYELAGYAFEPTPPMPDRSDWAKMLRQMSDGAILIGFFGSDPVASVAYSAMSQNVRGQLFDIGGVWGVATAPEARRKGYARVLLQHLFQQMQKDERPLSALYAFRESFYQRLGYTIFPQPRVARFKPQALAPLLDQDLGGRVERMMIADGFDLYRTYLKTRQSVTHGMAQSSEGPARLMQDWNSFWLAVAWVDGDPQGMMLYKLTGEEGRFTMNAPYFYYSSSRGKYLLLDWCARHADHADIIKLRLPPDERPDTWMADLDVKYESFEGPLCRIIDLAQIGGIPVGAGEFTAQIRDPHCSWNEGVYRLEEVDGHLRVTPASQPNCTLYIQAISALIYGTHDPADFAIRGWGDPDPQTISAMKSMFPTALPYLHEVF
jgi:predicted acetyltransferase